VKKAFRRYYSLTKPGVLYGNAITGVAGFLLASSYFRTFDFWLFAATIVGMTLVIASACVLNNVLDRDIDSKMERTKTRATVLGAVKGRNAVVFSILLGGFGIGMLALWTNWLVVAIGVGGFIDYVVLYGMLSKRLSIHGTLVGSISGAAPILAGYVAVSGRIDAGAIIAFAMLFLWQLPEFYSIAIYRHDEYKAAGVPVMAVIKGIKNTKWQIYAYTAAFVTATLLLTAYGYTGWVYLMVMGLLGACWLWIGAKGFEAKTKAQNEKWARRMFRFSLIMVLMLSLMVSIGPLLP
jgi:heme o synthase